jgi:hypothetical protein
MSAFSKSIAILIGVDKYQDANIHNLKTPIADAELLANVLEMQGFEVQKHFDASLVDMQNLFEKLQSQCDGANNIRLLVYYAGHGTREDSKEGLRGHITPSDAIKGNMDTFLSMRDLDQTLRKINAKHLLLVLDCCFAGVYNETSMQRGERSLEEEKVSRQYYDMFTEEPTRKILTSASSRQLANDIIDYKDKNSPFARFLVEGIEGAADFNKDKLVTITELQSFVRDKLGEET